MSTIASLLSEDHTRCDDLFAEAEASVSGEAWEKGAELFRQFREAMGRHFTAEEETLFPAFEAHTGMSQGPTQVMRSEHEQMNELLGQMQSAIEGRNSGTYLGLSETLLMLMRQHNLKEEQILYPMSDQALAGEQDSLIPALNKTLHPNG